MEKAIRKLISNSIRLRTWTTLSNYVATHSSLQNTVDSTLSVQDVASKELGNIKNIQENHKNLNGYETIEMITTLQESIRKGYWKKPILSRNLLQICQNIQRDIRFLNRDHIIMSLHILTFLKVPSNSEIVQSLLQLLKVYINNLTVIQIKDLHLLLSQQARSPLTEALIKALPYVFRNQIEVECERKDAFTLSKALQYAYSRNDVESIQYIINEACTNMKFINIHLAVIIFYSLDMLPYLSQSSLNVLSKAKDSIISNYNYLNMQKVNKLLAIILGKFKEGIMSFYDEKVVDALCKYVTSKNVTFQEGTKVLNKLNTLSHSDIHLLDYLVGKCSRNTLAECNLMDVAILIKGFATADYKVEFWKSIEITLLQYLTTDKHSMYQLSFIGYRLISLGCYSPELLEKIFTLYYCTYETYNNSFVDRNMLMINQALQYLHPEYNGITLSMNMVDEIVTRMKNSEKNTTLYGNLKKVLGNDKYIKVGLKTKFGLLIDYTIMLQPDGSPMAINDIDEDIIFVEDLVVPPDCHKLFISILPKDAYCINLQTMQSTWRLLLNVVKASTGSNIIPLNPYFFSKLSDHEINVFLQEIIKLKFNNVLKSINN